MWKTIGGVLGLVTIIALIVAVIQFWQTKEAADAQDAAQSAQIEILQEQLNIQREMATLQANASGSGPTATAISLRLTELAGTAVALATQASQPVVAQPNVATVDTQAFTQAEINALLGTGNWFCYPDDEYEIGIRSIPGNFVVQHPLQGVEKDGVLYSNGETVSNSGSQGGTGYLQDRLPSNECPNQIPGADSQLPITKDTINEVLGEGNWSCFSDRYDGVRVNNIPTNFVIKLPLSNVDKEGIKYGYGETIPSGGSATAWLQGTLDQSQCP